MVENLTVEHDARMQIVVLVEAQLSDGGTVGVHLIEVRDPFQSVPARYRLVRGRRAEHNPSVRKIAGVEAVDVVRHPGNLPQVRPIDADLPDLPVRLVGPCEQQSVGVPVHVDLADVPAVLGPIERDQFLLRMDRREDGDLIVVSDPRQGRIALVIGWKSHICPGSSRE